MNVPRIPSPHKSNFDVTLLLSRGFFAFGLVLLFCAGPVQVACYHANPLAQNPTAQCTITRSVALGLIPIGRISLTDVRAARMDRKTVMLHGINRLGEPDWIPAEVYGALLIGEESVVIDAYDQSSRQTQDTVERINRFLAESEAAELVFQLRNVWLNLLTFTAFGLSILLFFKPWMYRR